MAQIPAEPSCWTNFGSLHALGIKGKSLKAHLLSAPVVDTYRDRLFAFGPTATTSSSFRSDNFPQQLSQDVDQLGRRFSWRFQVCEHGYISQQV